MQLTGDASVSSDMYVIRRRNVREKADIGKIQSRLSELVESPYPLKNVNVVLLASKVAQGLCNDIKTSQLDEFAATTAALMVTTHQDYVVLASRIAISNHQKNCTDGFRGKITKLWLATHRGQSTPMVSEEFYKFVTKHHRKLSAAIDYDRDFLLSYHGFKRLEGQMLKRINGQVVECPQDLFMRVAIAIHMPLSRTGEFSLDQIIETYNNLSLHKYTHATPTLINAGSVTGNLSSCFVLGTEDSMRAIAKTTTDCMLISQSCGGIGTHMTNVRANGSLIRSTSGPSSGIVPFMQLYESAARCANQGGKRNGSIAVYIEPHHADIEAFLNLRKSGGDEKMRARDLFLGLWVSDLFMERAENDEMWSLMCPDRCPGLNEVFGDEYRQLYEEYESKNMYEKQLRARDIFRMMYESIKEGGIPYIMFKDQVNRCNMQNNLGVIRSSNLCSEITLYNDSKQYAVCNLASVCLSEFVVGDDGESTMFPKNPVFDYKGLMEVVGQLVINLNNVIDRNYNPVVESAKSNFMHRPIGIGVQGLADVFIKFRTPFDSDLAREINRNIAECMYYAAVSKSCDIAEKIYTDAVRDFEKTKKFNALHIIPKRVLNQFPELKNIVSEYDPNCVPQYIGAYPSFTMPNAKTGKNAPMRDGIFHWELFGLKHPLSGLCDWESLRARVMQFGVRNSTLMAYMPTATTSDIMGNSKCFEPYFSNIYESRTLSGSFVMTNKYLMHDLDRLGLWNRDTVQTVLADNGSVKNLYSLSSEMKQIYRTVWEVKQRSIVDMAIDRQPFIDQSQSTNLFIENLTFNTFSTIQMHAWRNGAKTGSYYIHTAPAVDPSKVTVDAAIIDGSKRRTSAAETGTLEVCKMRKVGDEECMMCSS
jgi:ribonucleoside-diphosphate reductase alpha chain